MRMLALLLILLLTGPDLPAAAPPNGPGQFTLAGQEPVTVFTFRPAHYAGGPLLVVLHGMDRNAKRDLAHAIPLAERFQMLAVAPEFDAARFPNERYQRGGVLRAGKAQPKEAWTFAIVHRLVAEVRHQEGQETLPFYLIGHSAGGQFLLRMAALMPGGAQRIVASNPGSLLFPTRALPYGFGFAGLPADLDSDAALRAYLAAPVTLYLGTEDLVQDLHFDTSNNAMKQGATRLDRGRAGFAMAQALAAERHWPCNWQLVESPGIGHSSTGMYAAAEAGQALFGLPAQGAAVPAQPGTPGDPSRLELLTGSYRLAPGQTLSITRVGDALFAQATHQPKVKLTATGERSFLCAPAKAVITFAGEARGPAQTLILNQAGKEIRAERLAAGDLERQEAREILLAPATLQAYAGRYALGADQVLILSQEGGHLRLQAGESLECELYATSPQDFFAKAADLQLRVETGPAGTPVRLTLRWNGQPVTATRIR